MNLVMPAQALGYVLIFPSNFRWLASLFVIPGLDPGIHAVGQCAYGPQRRAERRHVDARVKPGHDGVLG